ncbi:hypothetical protein SLA2020_368120 [Shorea laevis]
METADSAGQVEASLEFDFNFDEDNLMENPHMQKPLNDHPQGGTAANISSQDQYVELGSSSGSNQPMMNRTNSKAKLTQSTMTSNDLSDPPENAELRSLAGTNWSCLNNEGSNQNLKQSALSSLGCFNTPNQKITTDYDHDQVGLVAYDGAVQSFQAHDQVIYPNQQMNGWAENVPQIEHMPLPQNRVWSNKSKTIANKPTTGHFTPHNQNTPYRPFTPLGTQANEFMTANVYDPHCINFMQHQAYALLRPRSFLHHQFDQVPVPPTVYDPQGYNSMLPELSILARPPQLANYHQQPNQVWNTQNSLLPGSSMPSRLQQQFCGRQQLNQSAHLMPNVLNPQLGGSMLPEQNMLSGRSQLLDHYEQSNQVAMTPCACNPQQHNSTAAAPAVLPSSMRSQPSILLSRPQQSSQHQRLNQVTETENGLDPKHHNILLPESSTPFSLQTIQTHGWLNQTRRQSIPYLSSGTNAQQTQILNSQTEREIGGRKNRVAIPDLCETSVRGFKEKGPVEGQRRAAKRHLLGEAPLPCKHSRIRQERSSQEEDRTSQSEGNEVENSNLSNPSNTRPVKNAVYDPTFEGIGLPVDPHLRLFASC